MWNRIKQPLLCALEDAKNKPDLEPVRSKFTLRGRKRFALAVLRRFRDSGLFDAEDLAIPNFSESSLFIQNIIRSPIVVRIDESSFAEEAEDLLHGLFDEWRTNLQDRLLHQVACAAQASTAFSETAHDELLLQLSLARTVFTCQCSQLDVDVHSDSWPSTFAIKPLFYPQVLGHICIRSAPELLVVDRRASALVLGAFRSSRGYPGPQTWDCSSLRLNAVLGDIVHRIILKTHLDPETATAQDMDELDVYFACMSCAVQDEDDIRAYDVQAFRWREAVSCMDHIPL